MNVHARLSEVSFNLPDIDEAFPRLVGHVESLHASVLNSDDDPLVLQKFQLVAVFSIRIFHREEEAMALCRDKGAAMHRATHQKFLASLSALQARFETSSSSVALAHDIRAELLEWLVDHHHLMNANLGRVIKSLVERSIQHHQSLAGTAA
jgi:hemerythrin